MIACRKCAGACRRWVEGGERRYSELERGAIVGRGVNITERRANTPDSLIDWMKYLDEVVPVYQVYRTTEFDANVWLKSCG